MCSWLHSSRSGEVVVLASVFVRIRTVPDLFVKVFIAVDVGSVSGTATVEQRPSGSVSGSGVTAMDVTATGFEVEI